MADVPAKSARKLVRQRNIFEASLLADYKRQAHGNPVAVNDHVLASTHVTEGFGPERAERPKQDLHAVTIQACTAPADPSLLVGFVHHLDCDPDQLSRLQQVAGDVSNRPHPPGKSRDDLVQDATFRGWIH